MTTMYKPGARSQTPVVLLQYDFGLPFSSGSCFLDVQFKFDEIQHDFIDWQSDPEVGSCELYTCLTYHNQGLQTSLFTSQQIPWGPKIIVVC